MYKKIAILTLALSLVGNIYAKEPKNLDFIKQDLIHYQASGAYQKDLANVVDQAMLYLKTRLESEKKSPSNKKFAVVLDIDETSLSNYPDMVKMGFGGTFDEVVHAEGNATDPVIKPTLELYRYAKENKIAVFFVTGRTESFREATAKNLQTVGYKDYDGLFLKAENYHNASAAPYKIEARNQIEKMGYDIILNMGDQRSDLLGGHADKTFKLPNPYYYIP